MLLRLLVSALLLITASVSAEKVWLFPMPIFFDNRELGEINVFTDGESFEGVPANEIRQKLEGIVTPQVLTSLNKYGSQKVNNTELNPLGVWLSFSAADLVLEISLEADAHDEQLIDFDGIYESPVYSQSTFFAWHNTFNLSNDYQIDAGDFATNSWLGEWISNINLGGALGLNFELAGYVEGRDSERPALDDKDPKFYRGDARVFIDRPSYPLRFTGGDVTSITTGHQPSLNLGGVAVERLWSSLQPDRNIQNGGSQVIYLRESAQVFIYINDVYFTDVRLTPGRYQIDDLPLSDGNNDIRIEIRYQSGQREVINYSQFFNTRLLREGISDFGLYGGLFSTVIDDEYEYDTEQYAIQGFYEYGVTNEITTGVNFSYHPLGQIAGVVLNFGTQWGNFGNRLSALAYEDRDEFGTIFSLDYEQSILGNLGYTSPNLRFSYEFYNDYRATPWLSGQSLSTAHRINADYRYYVTSDIDYLFRATWFDVEGQVDPDYTLNLEISWAPWDFIFTSGIEYEFDGENDLDELTYYFIGRWDWFSSVDFYSASVEYQTRTETVRANFAKQSALTPNDYGYDLTGEYAPDRYSYSVRGDYVANRFLTELEYRRDGDIDDDTTVDTVSARFSTAVSMFGSDIAWGRSYSGPAAIARVHDSLDVPVMINGVSEDEPELIATRSMNGLVPLYGAHSRSTVLVGVPDAPIGYDYGPDTRGFVAGTYTGHVFDVGSDASKTVIGRLLDSDGKPIVLRNGTVKSDSDEKSFFTNRGGRFALDGVRAGRYRIIIRGNPSFYGELLIPDSDENLVYLDAIRLKVGEQP